MKTDRKGKIDVKEKFGDYLMDISKYVFTAVMLATLFDDVISSICIKCVVGILFVLVVILFTIFYFYKR